jgi:hypothetical protein
MAGLKDFSPDLGHLNASEAHDMDGLHASQVIP